MRSVSWRGGRRAGVAAGMAWVAGAVALASVASVVVPGSAGWAKRASAAASGSAAGSRRAGADIATVPVSRMDTPWWRARFEAKQAELARMSPELVWLGDSITQDWERDGPQDWARFKPVWDRYYGDRRAIDLGFKGDSTCHVLWRLDHGELASMGQPKALVLLIGANNFGHIHTDAAQTQAGIEAILARLRAGLPRTQLVVIGVLPSIRSAWVDRNTAALDAGLAAALRGRPMVTYVDAGSIFRTDGRVDPSRFLDPYLVPPDPPLHPTAQAQARIAALIAPVLAQAGFAAPAAAAADPAR